MQIDYKAKVLESVPNAVVMKTASRWAIKAKADGRELSSGGDETGAWYYAYHYLGLNGRQGRDKSSSYFKVKTSPNWPNHFQIIDDDGDTVEIASARIDDLIKALAEYKEGIK
jgi:hypothetical protein